MEHHSVAQVEPTMADARRVVGADEKHQIAGLGVAGGGAVVVEPLGSQPSHIPAALIEHPGQVAGAVKGSGWGATAPYIGITSFLMT